VKFQSGSIFGGHFILLFGFSVFVYVGVVDGLLWCIGFFLGFDLCVGLLYFGFLDQVVLDLLGYWKGLLVLDMSGEGR
jgi:hypothetical protein